MKDFLKNNFLFYLLYLLVICFCTYYLLSFDKIALHQKINSVVGNSGVDIFYKYFTHLGDGLFAIILGVVVLFVNIKNGLYLLIAHAISGGTAAILKNYVYNYDRPHFVFGYYHHDIKLKFVEGVEMVGQNSFPSGHATTAFTIYTCLALLTPNKLLKILFLLIAVNAAYSRTYLSQHWLIDIYAGSMIGIGVATILYFVFKNDVVNKLNRPLFKLK